MNILVDLTNAVIKSTLLVLSMGTAAAATSASGSMMTALKNTAKKKMKMLMKNVRNGHFKANQVIVPGMIDTTTARIESPQLIAESLLRYIRAAGHPSRVIAGTDCGFASTSKSAAVTSDADDALLSVDLAFA